MYQDGSLDPEANAALLEINGLPEYFDDNKLYDIFRPFGPLNLCKCVKKGSSFKGTAFIQFFNNFSSEEAERNLVRQKSNLQFSDLTRISHFLEWSLIGWKQTVSI